MKRLFIFFYKLLSPVCHLVCSLWSSSYSPFVKNYIHKSTQRDNQRRKDTRRIYIWEGGIPSIATPILNTAPTRRSYNMERYEEVIFSLWACYGTGCDSTRKTQKLPCHVGPLSGIIAVSNSKVPPWSLKKPSISQEEKAGTWSRRFQLWN